MVVQQIAIHRKLNLKHPVVKPLIKKWLLIAIAFFFLCWMPIVLRLILFPVNGNLIIGIITAVFFGFGGYCLFQWGIYFSIPKKQRKGILIVEKRLVYKNPDYIPEINPATGYPMASGGIDVAGNPKGFKHH